MTPGGRLSAAIEVLAEIDTDPRPADRVLAAYWRTRRYAGSKDRNAVADRVYGVLRRRTRLDWWIRAKAGWVSVGARQRIIADMLLTDSLSSEGVQAAFSGTDHAPESLDAAEAEMASALDGASLNADDMPEAVRWECPEWAVEPLKKALGTGFPSTMAAMLEEAAFDLRLNTAKTADRNAIVAKLGKAGLDVIATPLSPIGLRSAARRPVDGLAAFKAGEIEVQDEGAQIAAMLADARPGMQIADYCAGAGGKTLVMAADMKNKGRVLACDTSEGRLERSAVRTKRAGLHNVERRVLDPERADRRLKRLAGRFDRVMVDAPCTGLGTWRRNPDARWRYGPDDLAEMTALQDRILDRASRLTSPGGRLIYVTCSLFREENEDRIEAFLSRSPIPFQPLDVTSVWAETVERRGGAPCPETDGPWLRLTPDKHGTDGFFVAILERETEADQPGAS